MATSMKGLLVLALLFFGGGFIGSILLLLFVSAIQKIIWIWIPVIIGYGFFTKICINAWQERNNYIKVNDQGIAVYTPYSQKEFIKWEDISRIRENNIFERLIIADKQNKQIKIEYELENLTKLLNILLKNISHLTEKYSSIKIFRRTAHLHVFFLVALLFVISFMVYGLFSGLYFQSIAFAGFSALIVYVLLIEFIRIEINEESICTVFPLWKKTIEFSEISKITIENIRGSNGKAAQCVLLKLNSGKTIRLNAVKEGTIPLFTSINNMVDQLTMQSSCRDKFGALGFL